ncbi:MAG: glycosyltransferase family 39 protein [Phycisphaerales bacterium]
MLNPTSELYDQSAGSGRSALRPVLLLALGLALLRLLYLMFWCPYSLIEDEAQYWVWSRHLAWSYYTKGPGIAWTISASTRVFGDGEWAVRLPAVLSSVVALLAICALAWDAFRSRSVVTRTMWCAVLAPAYLAMALMMTIDGPYVACWAVASWAAWRAIMMGRARWLVVLGLAVGVGVLYKYTMLLILPGVLLLLWRFRRSVLVRPASWAFLFTGGVLMLLAFLPVVLWNQEHGWPTIRHLLGHLGVQGGDVQVTQGGPGRGWHYNPLWTLTLIGTQLGLVGPVLVLAILGAVHARRERLVQPAAWRAARFLVAVALPMYLFYLCVSFVAEPEGNWPIAGSVTLIPLAGRMVVIGWEEFRRRVREWRALPPPRPWRGLFMPSPWTAHSALWAATIVMGLCVGVFALRLDLFTGIPVLGRLIPIGRLTGGPAMGQDAQVLADQLRQETGREPFVLTAHYGRASLLTYYMPAHPDAYCASSLTPGGRTTPWDFWHEMDLDDPQLLTRPALVVGLTREHWLQAFERVGEPIHLAGDLKVDKQGRPARPAFKAYGFKGFPLGGVRDPGAGGTP